MIASISGAVPRRRGSLLIGLADGQDDQVLGRIVRMVLEIRWPQSS